MTSLNPYALQHPRRERRGCNRRVLPAPAGAALRVAFGKLSRSARLCAWSLSLGRSALILEALLGTRMSHILSCAVAIFATVMAFEVSAAPPGPTSQNVRG